MKILITGSNGQLGTELQKLLRRVSSTLGSLPACLDNAEVVAIDVNDLDITDAEATTGCIKSIKPDAVINCAAYTNVDACETDRDTAFRVNALGVRNLASASEKIGAKILHVSTDYVFSGNADKPYCEYDMPSPMSVYGATKLMGETYLRSFSTRWYIVRTAWLYGERGKNFVKTIIKAAKERPSLKVVDDQRGNPTNAEDLAWHILNIITTEEYGIYHCTGQGECTWYEFAKEIVRLAGINTTVNPCTSDEYPSPTKRPTYSSLEHLMLRTTIGDSMRHWQSALEDYISKYERELLQ